MKIDYIVNSIADDQSEIEVTISGAKVMARVPVLMVELVSVDDSQKNPTIVIPAGMIDGARDLFAPCARITATFAATK